MLNKVLNFIEKSPTAFNAVDTISDYLEENDYLELNEGQEFKLKKGGKYYVCRNGSSIIAFNVGKKLNDVSLHLTSSHTDCPCLKLKPQAMIKKGDSVQLNVEIYGGILMSPWFDRPLALAGRVIVKDDDKLKIELFDSKEAFALIPSVAPHMNRAANDGIKYNPQVDLLPLVSLNKNFSLEDYLAKKLDISKDSIMSFDLYLYPLMSALKWGEDGEFISSYHLDDLECSITTLLGFVNTFNDDNINIYASFDNEEVGSLTRQGADSDFLQLVIKRICQSLKLDYHSLLYKSMNLSCDNAHALHPNHPELADPLNKPELNKGLVIKYNANQSYTSDALGFALFKDLLDKKGLLYQVFTNRSDIRGGSTLGNISNSHVSILSLDIGLAQLAMHSPYETAGSKDVETMINAVKCFYEAHLSIDDNKYSL